MSASPLGLLKTRRLWPLVLTQSCGALNDNLVKNAIVVLALFQLGIGGTGLSALAGALFIAPYILLSATAGKLADRFSKPRVILIYKLAELLLMAAAAAAFLTESVPGLLAVLTGLGVQSTLFGPVKYGLLPEHLPEDELIAGNGVIEATTFLSIVCGTVAGGALVLLPHGTAWVGAAGIVLALLGLFAASRIPTSPAADPSLRLRPNVFAESWRLTRQAAAIRPIWLSLLGLSWFWTIGATLITEFPVVARDTLQSDGTVLTLFLAVFAIGVGVGSVQCARLLHGEVSARLVPFAALGISLFCWDFASAAASAGSIATAFVALSSFAGWRMIVDLFLLAACGGVFSVPLYAIIQDAAAPSERSRMIAANNIMNALFMVAGAAAAATLAAIGLSAPAVLHIAAVANLFVALWIVRILPQEVYRALLRWYFRHFHHVQVHGLENYKAAGDRVVIVANHQSYLDACLIAACLPDSPTFAIHSAQAAKWYFKPFLAAVETFPVDVQSPYSVKRMVEAVRDHGRKLMIFPEGRMTRTGALMKIYEGAAMVADKSQAKVVPICIEGLQFSRLGRMRGRLRLRWFPPLRMNILPPVTLSPPHGEDLTPRQRREATGRALQDVMVNAAFVSKETGKSLFSALLDARDRFGGQTIVAEDIERAPIGYDRIVIGSAALGRALSAVAPGETYVALMMPNAAASVVAFMGMQAFGVVPCLLNISAGAAAMLSACRTAGVRSVISSRTFVEKGRLTKVVERMADEVRFVWLEDVRASIGLRAKLRAKWDASWARRLRGAVTEPDAPAVVLFTSGSEGAPKGVVLSHRNLLANCAQVASVIDFSGGDIVFNAMPMFHAFGLTGGTILPLISGVRTFHYPSPLHYRVVPALIYDTDATICFGTDTFLNGWARYAHPYDFYAMRYIFSGAEKVREDDQASVRRPFRRARPGRLRCHRDVSGARAQHGDALPSRVSRPVPAGHRVAVGTGRRHRYRRPSARTWPQRDARLPAQPAPGVLEPPEDGWYDTGDIVTVDAAGFVTIAGRAKRFAKIGGEMVSMAAAEALVDALWPEAQHAVVSVPDPRKGEALLLVTTRQNADGREVLAAARARMIPEIMVPRAVLCVPSIPLLGTGKVDYPAVQRLVGASRASAEAALV